VLSEVVDYFVEVTVIIVNDSPSATPSWNAVNLTQGTTADDWSVVIEVSERDKRTIFIVGKTMIYLI